jgi:Zn-dependent metalloprotease
MKKLFYLLFLLCPLIVSGQQKLKSRILDKNGVINHLVFDNSETFIPIDKGRQLLHDSLKLLNDDALVLTKETKDYLGITQQIFEQNYKGIKVEDGLFGIYSKNGKINYISGEFKKIRNVITEPKITETDALNKALENIKANKYRWQITSEETNIKVSQKNQFATYYPKGELLICRDLIKSDSIYRLAYKFDIFAAEPLSHALYYIDAITGDLLDVRSLIFDVNTSATGTSLYRGVVPIITDSYPGGFRLFETRSANNVVIHTFNANHSPYMPPTGFTENSNSSTTWPSNAAIDAHWGAEKVFDYWNSSPRNRNSLDNSGMAINGYVHWNSGSYADNALWDGNEMLYGDGSTVFKNVVSLDVIAHETGHGIQQYACQLSTSSGGETQAINEGLSDIWGAVIENWVAPDPTNNWLIGEQIMLNNKQCLRSLRSPKTEGYNNPIYPGGYPNTYQRTYWVNVSNCQIHYPDDNDHCSCHTNSTILSHWFYLLANGEVGGTNDIPNTYTVWGIGIAKAAEIVWRTESVNLTTHHNAQYNDVMTQTIAAATDLSNGDSNSNLVMQVRNAWYAVGFGTQPTQMNLTGNSILCSTGASYTLSNTASGSLTWTTSANISRVSNQGSNPCTFQAVANANSSGWIQANFNGVTGPIINVWAGTPGSPITNPSGYPTIQLYLGDMPLIRIASAPGATTLNGSWWSSGSIVPSGNTLGSQCVFEATSYGTGNFYVTTTNGCGTSTPGGGTVNVRTGRQLSIQIIPNPATVEINVNLMSRSADGTYSNIADQTVNAYDATIYNSYGVPLYTWKTRGETSTINITGWQKGTYIISMKNKDEILTNRFIVQ